MFFRIILIISGFSYNIQSGLRSDTSSNPISDVRKLVPKLIQTFSQFQWTTVLEIVEKFNEPFWFTRMESMVEFMGNDLQKSRGFLMSNLFRD
jgi:hypothetical protein